MDQATEVGNTPCGLNGRGVLARACANGSWTDTQTCNDPDECVDDDTQSGNTACGLNGRGLLEQLCVAGSWVDAETCNDPDACVDDDTRSGSTACGLNNAGTFEQSCVVGSWTDTEICDDPDECVDDDTRSGSTACGLNGRGDFEQLCVAGFWTDTQTCNDPDECLDDGTQDGSTPCGLNLRGALDQHCVTGQWEDTTTCDDPDECAVVDNVNCDDNATCVNASDHYVCACDNGFTGDGTVCLKDGLSVYVVPAITNDQILPDGNISGEYATLHGYVRASPGEYEPLSFAIRSDSPDSNISALLVVPTDLDGSTEVIEATHMDVRLVKVWYQSGVATNEVNKRVSGQVVPYDI